MSFYYPNLVTERKPINNIKTYKNNSIFMVKISDNVDVDEDEPEILYTGLHHARVNWSASVRSFTTCGTCWRIRQESNDQRNTGSYGIIFRPVVNPDGMEYNLAGYDAGQR
jgi:murein tripeptide amidase MpaA